MTHTSVGWMATVPAARRLGISVRQLYAAIEEGRIDGRWVHPGLQVEVAVDDDTARRLGQPARAQAS